MAKRMFVSFNVKDRVVTKQVNEMLARITQQIGIEAVWVENDVSYNGETAIAWELEQLMSDCDAALFVLGDNPRTSPWLDKEASLAIARELPLLVTSLPDVEVLFPEFMDRVNCQTVDWLVDDLCEAIESLGPCLT